MHLLDLLNSFLLFLNLNHESVLVMFQACPHVPIRLHTQVRLTNVLCKYLIKV